MPDISFLEGAGLLALTTFGAMLISSWGNIKEIFRRLWSYVVITIHLENEASSAVLVYLNSSKTFKRSRFGNRTYGASANHIKQLRKSVLIAWEQLGGSSTIYRRKLRFFWLNTGERETGDGYKKKTYSISCIRYMFNIDKFVKNSIDYYNDIFCSPELAKLEQFNRYSIIRVTRSSSNNSYNNNQIVEDSQYTFDISFYLRNRLLGWSVNDLSQKEDKSLSQLSLTKDVQREVKEIVHWAASEEWYHERKVPWRRNWLLHGEPGTGKTALVRAIAEELDLPVYIYDLASIDNAIFQENWSQMLSNTPCIALLEDLDSVFRGRKNIAVGKNITGLTFDILLNCLDGIQRCNGLFTVITTNHPEKLDPAIGISKAGDSLRPGRIDRIIHMKNLTEDGRRKIAKRILKDFSDRDIEETVASHLDITGAQFQEVCTRKAVSEFLLLPGE